MALPAGLPSTVTLASMLPEALSPEVKELLRSSHCGGMRQGKPMWRMVRSLFAACSGQDAMVWLWSRKGL